MRFYEKLKRAAAEVNKSKVGDAVGLGKTTISNYIAKKSIPRADIALKIARALKVPLEWLVDDAADWPPPAPIKFSAGQLTDHELMMEFARRYRLELMRRIEALEAIDRMIAAKSFDVQADHLRALVRNAFFVSQATLDFASFNVKQFAEDHHSDLPGSALSISDLDAIVARVDRIGANHDFRAAVGRLAPEMAEFLTRPGFAAQWVGPSREEEKTERDRQPALHSAHKRAKKSEG